MPRRVVLLFIFFLLCGRSSGQEVMNLDSLLKVLTTSKDDTNKVLLYINIGQQYESNDIEQAKDFYKKAKQLSEKINYKLGVIKYIANYTFILNQQEKYDSSILLNKQAVALAKEIGNQEYLAKSTFNLGSSYRYAGINDTAITYYEEGKKLFGSSDEWIQAQSNDILQVLYSDLGQYDRAIELGEKALAFFRKAGSPNPLAVTLMNLGVSYSSKSLFDKAIPLFNEALQISKQVNNQQVESNIMLNLANIYMQKNDYGKIKPYFEKTIELSRLLSNQENIAIALRGLSVYYLFKDDLPKAKQYIDSALAITSVLGAKMQHRKNLETKSSILYAMHDMVNAEKCLQQSTAVGDSLMGDKIQELSVQYEKKYESEKKDNQIKLQQVDLKRKNVMNYILIFGSAALLCIVFLLYRNHRHQQALQQQRINELETEKKLLATEAILQGEEKERSRLAKDLHDGLGGLLSGIKYSFQSMKGNLIMTPENAQAFERSMDMLDSSIKEMRRVAHNLMPEALVKFGLDTALKDFCNDINQSGALKVSYQSIGLEQAAIDQTTAISVYRIVQELINNVLKHAAASTAIVQVSKTDNSISITVEDDGKGFDPSQIEKATGIGWSNIKHRVDLLKGKLDVNSQPGQGTSVLIEFLV